MAPPGKKAGNFVERFWSKVQKSNGCWTWNGTIHDKRKPYGDFLVGSRTDGSRRIVKAHRMAWILTYGEIFNGIDVLHKCDNHQCVNPSHLFLGTNFDNVQDKVRKGRAKTLPQRGEDNPAAKLTKVQVEDMRRLRADGAKQEALAAMFGVRQSAVSRILNFKRWGG